MKICFSHITCAACAFSLSVSAIAADAKGDQDTGGAEEIGDVDGEGKDVSSQCVYLGEACSLDVKCCADEGICQSGVCTLSAMDASTPTPKLLISPFITYGFAELWLISNIPHNVRQVSAFTTGEERELDERFFASSLFLGVGARIDYANRLMLLTELVYEEGVSQSAEQDFHPRDEYVNYFFGGWSLNIIAGYKTPIGLIPQIGYRVSWMHLESGADAYSEFRMQHRVALPNQAIFGFAYQYPTWPQDYFEPVFYIALPFGTAPSAYSVGVIICRLGFPFLL